MNKPRLLLILVLLTTVIVSCGERRKQKKEAKRGFTWELKGEKGVVLTKDIRSLLKKYPKVFGNTSILNDFNDADTAGFFVQNNDYVWMSLYTSEAENAMGYLCARKQKNGCFLVLSDAGSEFWGEDQRTDEYLSKAGPYIILKQPSGNAVAPEVYRIDGTEIYTNDLEMPVRVCNDYRLNTNDPCFRETFRFEWKNERLQSVHERRTFIENDTTTLRRFAYKVHYTIQENDLRSRDTTWLP